MTSLSLSPQVNVEGQQGERVTEAQVAHVENEIAVRAANIVRAAEALSKLVSDIKESLILNDFSTINEVTSQRIEELQQQTSQQQRELVEVYASMSKEMREPTNQLTEDSGGQSNTTMTSNITSNITTTNVV